MKIKKILLINPNNSVSLGSLRRMPTPLGLMYIAAVLEENRFSVSILDCALEGYDNVKIGKHSEIYGLEDDQIIEKIKNINPDLIGITCLMSKFEREIKRLCSLIKNFVSKDIITVLGGIHPTYFAKEMMTDCKDIDFIIKHEGEQKLVDFIKTFNENKNLENVNGLVFKDHNKIIENESTSKIKDLDSIPFPARHLIDMEKYIDIGLFSNPFPKRERMAQVLTSRGCPFHCNFCATQPYWGKFRGRSAENIFKEIVFLKEKYNIQEIQFRDDNMTVNKKNALKLFKMMEGLDLSWCAGISMVDLDERMIKSMAKSGCYRLTLSPESGSKRVLKEIIHKPLKIDWVKPIINLVHKYDIDVHSDFVIGLPGETKEEMYETFKFAEDINTDSCAFFFASPFPGSSLYDQCMERGWIKNEKYAMDLKTPSIVILKDEPEYVMSHKKLTKLLEEKTIKFNECSKKRNPEKWEMKYKVFLEKQSKRNKKQQDKLIGRVV